MSGAVHRHAFYMSPILENYVDEAMKSQTFQLQIVCLTVGSPTLVFDDSVEGCLGCS